MTLSAARSRAASSARRSANAGTCSAISSATAWAARHVGPAGDAKTRRARSPISAERTFASATRAGGSQPVYARLGNRSVEPEEGGAEAALRPEARGQEVRDAPIGDHRGED